MPQQLISTDEFCTHYEVEYSFINSLKDYGLIEVTTMDQGSFIDQENLSRIEKLMRLHYDLDINMKGIEAITYLLTRIKNLQSEVITLKNRLRIYEDENL